MGVVCTGYLHFALGIELVGVGGYMGMTVLYFFGCRIAMRYRSGPVCEETFAGYCMLCGAFKCQAGRPNGRSTSLHQNSRKTQHCQP